MPEGLLLILFDVHESDLNDDNPPPGFEPLSLPISVTTPTVIADTVPIRASK